MTGRLSLLFALLVSQPLDAQAPGPLDGAAETITAHDLRAKIEILAHDSMMGRDTPSPGLERAAAYVVGEFHKLGLRPAGELGTYVQRFGVSRWTVDTGASSLELAAGATRSKAAFGSEVRVIGGEVSGKPIGGAAVLVAGPLTREVTSSPRLRGGGLGPPASLGPALAHRRPGGNRPEGGRHLWRRVGGGHRRSRHRAAAADVPAGAAGLIVAPPLRRLAPLHPSHVLSPGVGVAEHVPRAEP